MNIQIFMSKKNFDCQKAERWFKERKIKFQSVDLAKKGMSPREFDAVAAQVDLMNLIDTENKKYAESAVRFMHDKDMIRAQLLENPHLIKGPIVRNGRLATVGYHPEVWETWE
jgi:arsenate reductase